MQEAAAKHVIIMGAGPAGLTAGYELMRHDVPVAVLEKDPHRVGGISRTEERRGYRFDIGGHRFFSKIARKSRISGPRSWATSMFTRGRALAHLL